VRGDLAARTNDRVFLHLDKGADLAFIPDRTAVEINQVGLKDADVVSQDYI
jgi:hypothetical protein